MKYTLSLLPVDLSIKISFDITLYFNLLDFQNLPSTIQILSEINGASFTYFYIQNLF